MVFISTPETPTCVSFSKTWMDFKHFLAVYDLSIISAFFTEYFLGIFTWKWTWFQANPKSPNWKPNFCRSRNAFMHVSICVCFLKQLYLFLVTNSIVTQLFLVSPKIFLELPLYLFCKFFTHPVAPI